jgi:hypothetical protein
VSTVSTQELDKDAFEIPVINPWRHKPSREQVRFAMDLCHTELKPPADRETIDRLKTMSSYEVSTLIHSLKIMRAKRLRDAPRNRPFRLVGIGPRL